MEAKTRKAWAEAYDVCHDAALASEYSAAVAALEEQQMLVAIAKGKEYRLNEDTGRLWAKVEEARQPNRAIVRGAFPPML